MTKLQVGNSAETGSSPHLPWSARVILFVAALCACVTSLCSPIRIYAGMDPRGSSLVAQALIQRHTIRVDNYKLPESRWLFEKINGHMYSTYPLGTPLFLVPGVAIALAFGGDMENDKADYILQKAVAVLTVSAFLAFTYMILKCFLDPVNSAFLAAGWTLGSGVMSTMGAALWSIDFAVILECLVVLIVARNYRGYSGQLRPIMVGIALFFGFLCRPSTALLAVPTAILFWVRSKKAAFVMVATFGVLLSLLCLFSFNEFGRWLPDYYSAYGAGSHTPGFLHWVKVLYGLTFGPARGVFVFQPFLILILLAVTLYLKQLWRNPLYWLAASWIVLDILMVSQWPMWWGGGSFGSRLLVESFPAWVILTGLVFSQVRIGEAHRTILTICFGLLLCLGIFINSYQGLYNWSTWEWNTFRNSDGEDSKYNYDWRFPQAFANPKMIMQMKKEDKR